MSKQSVEAFAEGLRTGQRAFNEGDFESAFAGLAPNVEWHAGGWVLDASVLHGRDAVIAFHKGTQEAGDWQVEVQDVLDAGNGSIVVHQRGHHVGRTTRIEGTMDYFQVYETGADGLVVRVREYPTLDEAREAAGLDG